jgi:hypothetical protein
MSLNIFEEIKLLAESSEEQLFIQDENGNLSTIVPGKVGKIVKVSSKGDLYTLIFDKERIGLEEIKSIETVDFNGLKEDLIKLFYDNLNYKLKKEAQVELIDLIEKYNLKKLQERKSK